MSGLRADGHSVKRPDGSIYVVADTPEIARLIAQAPTLLAQRDQLAEALRDIKSEADAQDEPYTSPGAQDEPYSILAETIDRARALLAEIDGEGEA